MKKIICLLLAVMIVVSATGCELLDKFLKDKVEDTLGSVEDTFNEIQDIVEQLPVKTEPESTLPFEVVNGFREVPAEMQEWIRVGDDAYCRIVAVCLDSTVDYILAAYDAEVAELEEGYQYAIVYYETYGEDVPVNLFICSDDATGEEVVGTSLFEGATLCAWNTADKNHLLVNAVAEGEYYYTTYSEVDSVPSHILMEPVFEVVFTTEESPAQIGEWFITSQNHEALEKLTAGEYYPGEGEVCYVRITAVDFTPATAEQLLESAWEKYLAGLDEEAAAIAASTDPHPDEYITVYYDVYYPLYVNNGESVVETSPEIALYSVDGSMDFPIVSTTNCLEPESVKTGNMLSSYMCIPTSCGIENTLMLRGLFHYEGYELSSYVSIVKETEEAVDAPVMLE